MRDRQERIRDDYVLIARELGYHRRALADLGHELAGLQARCTHPELGAGVTADGEHPVEPDECPDCGWRAKQPEGG
jgi:hypothetical protein